jgi:hypothetical protein
MAVLYTTYMCLSPVSFRAASRTTGSYPTSIATTDHMIGPFAFWTF